MGNDISSTNNAGQPFVDISALTKHNKEVLASPKAVNVFYRRCAIKESDEPGVYEQIIKIIVSRNGKILDIGTEMDNIKAEGKEQFITFLKVKQKGSTGWIEVLNAWGNLPEVTKNFLEASLKDVF
ncbi:hypothetical protein ACFLZV_01535 [Candidatus Margulisiibacteriota bacterium]